MALYSALYKIVSESVKTAAKGLIRDFNEIERLHVSRKGIADFVTSADIRVDKILQKCLSEHRPNFGFITEESGTIDGRDLDHNWIIDPIDGTTNFMHGIPHFAISVALENKGQIIAGMVFDPIKNEEFWAEKGLGAFLNENRIRVSERTEIGESLVATGFPFKGKKDHDVRIKELIKFMPRTAGIRRMGAASLDLAYVACGRYDAYWEHNLNVWDIAAGCLIVEEAGGKLSTCMGDRSYLETGSVLASNTKLHSSMQDMLNQAQSMSAA